jgi:hypothetical protein
MVTFVGHGESNFELASGAQRGIGKAGADEESGSTATCSTASASTSVAGTELEVEQPAIKKATTDKSEVTRKRILSDYWSGKKTADC